MAAYNLSFYGGAFYHILRVEPSLSSGRHFIIHDFEYGYPPAPTALLPA